MKKYVVSLFLIVVVLVSCLGMVACDKDKTDPNIIELYMIQNESQIISRDGFEYDIKTSMIHSYGGNENQSTSISCTINVTNMNVEAKTVELSNVFAVREDNGAKYKSSYFLGNKYIECEKSGIYSFDNYGLPTDVLENKYHFEFDMNGLHFVLHLYNDNYPFENEVTINGSEVKTVELECATLKISKHSILTGGINIQVVNKTDSSITAYITDGSIVNNKTKQTYTLQISGVSTYGTMISKDSERNIILYNSDLTAGEYVYTFKLFGKHFTIKNIN